MDPVKWDHCPNGCGPMRARRSGVGQLTLLGYECKCGYRCGPEPKRPPEDWNPDRHYQAGYAHASGYQD